MFTSERCPKDYDDRRCQRANWRVRVQRVFGARELGKQVLEWTDMSPCRELISQCTKSFDMTGEDMTCHDTVSHELLL